MNRNLTLTCTAGVNAKQRNERLMATQIVCLLIGFLLPYLWAGVTGRHRKRQFGSIDLHEPRAQARQLSSAGVQALVRRLGGPSRAGPCPNDGFDPHSNAAMKGLAAP